MRSRNDTLMSVRKHVLNLSGLGVQRGQPRKLFWVLCLVIGTIGSFAVYIAGIPENPPGYYVDESALSYNAYLVAETGAGEGGEKFPLFFPVYTGPFTQYANPTQIYLLALLFKIFGPGITIARLFAAAWVFAACLLLGLLARRISGSGWIGALVGGFALVTPWLFEVSRLVLETFFYPMALVLLLWAVSRVSLKEKWGLIDISAITFALVLLTYSYTIGRLLGPLLAGGLILFATGRKRVVSIASVWTAFALTLIPLAVYAYRHPELTDRFRTVSYFKPGVSFTQIAATFTARFFEELNPITMLIAGDINPRHHLPAGLGSFYIGAFALSLIGAALVILRHRKDRWWLYVLFGAFASIVPGAMTNDHFHTLRMIAYPIFLLVLTIPALSWLLGLEKTSAVDPVANPSEPLRPSRLTAIRQSILTALLTLTIVQAGHFFWLFHRYGADRGEYFDAGYKVVYVAAVARPERPIYLVDGYWGPAYVHALWYATLEGRDTNEFIHLPYRTRPPKGALVISSEQSCIERDLLLEEGGYLLYRKEGTASQSSRALPKGEQMKTHGSLR